MKQNAMKLQTKLVGAFVLSALVTLFLGGLGYYNVKKLGAALYEIVAVRLPAIQALNVINEAPSAKNNGHRPGETPARQAKSESFNTTTARRSEIPLEASFREF